MANIQSLIRNFKYCFSFLDPSFLKIYTMQRRRNRLLDNMYHIDRAVQWLCRAQDAFPDGGVARSYALVYSGYFERKGWIPSYPETTGYIIPTVFDVAHLNGSSHLHERAIRMTEWECAVQMENGAVMGGTVDQSPTPAVFNTGQVIFGWIRAFTETGREEFMASAIRAGRYLLSQQSADGSWRKNLSDFATDRLPSYTYNTRTAWALALLGETTGERIFSDACRQNIEFALNQQNRNGWFKANCLNDPDRPLLHTIAYCIRGILEAGQLLGQERYLDQARLAADALLARLQPNGSLSGRFDSQWTPSVEWSCLTGDAQMAIIWGRLFEITEDADYLKAMQRINTYLKGVQLLHTDQPDICGGIAGSYPLKGGYGTFEILNWAVKFFIDALLLEEELTGNQSEKRSSIVFTE